MSRCRHNLKRWLHFICLNEHHRIQPATSHINYLQIELSSHTRKHCEEKKINQGVIERAKDALIDIHKIFFLVFCRRKTQIFVQGETLFASVCFKKSNEKSAV